MTWSYATGVLTSTGATESSPDSLLAGIDIIEATAPNLGYRDGLVGWLNDVEVRVSPSSFIVFDDDSTILIRGNGFIKPQTGGVIHGSRSTLIFEGNAQKIDDDITFGTGATFIARRAKPNDPSPKIVYRNSVRMDYPNVRTNIVLAKVDIAGLDLYKPNGFSGFNVVKLYFGSATIKIVNNIRIFGGVVVGTYGTTYNDLYIENLGLGAEATPNLCVFNRPVYYLQTPFWYSAALRATQVIVRNPTFLNSCLNQSIFFDAADPYVGSWFKLVYTFKQTFKNGITNLQGVKVRYLRSRQSANGSPAWVAPDGVHNLSTNSSGTFAEIDLMDAYRQDTGQFVIERFNWSAKARAYDKKTSSENIFSNRILFQQPANMSAGYIEEVQMLSVSNLTLTEAQAAALTGITLTASGATGGTIAISSARTVAELWQYYRQWIAQLVNFDSEDTWTYNGTTLNVGAWTISGIEFLTGGTVVTSSATANGDISNLSITGNVVQAAATNLTNVNITGSLTYNDNTAKSVTFTNAVIGTVSNSGTGTITIVKSGTTQITTYTDVEINYLDSTLSFDGITSLTFYPTQSDRDAGTNAGATVSTTPYNFKFGSTVSGVLLSGTVYLRINASGVLFLGEVTLALGDNTLSLSDNTLLQAIVQKLDLSASNLTIVNNGVKNASIMVPHNADLS